MNVTKLHAVIFVSVAIVPTLRADYASEVLSDLPMAYWHLGEDGVATSFLDASGNAHDGAASAPLGVNAGLPSLLPGVPGNTAVRLTGAAADPNIVVPGWDKYAPGSTGYTVEFWLQPEVMPSAFQNLVGDGEVGTDFYFMNYLSPTGLARTHFTISNNPVSIDSTSEPLLVGRTYHIVSTWDQALKQGRIYVNGSLRAFTTMSISNVPGATVANNPVFIGRDGRSDGNSPNAKFLLDEVSYYNKPLSPARVLQHFTSGAAYVTGLRHRISFDESASGTGAASDSIGTLSGTFSGNVTRTTGLAGSGGAALFNNTTGGVNIGNRLNLSDLGGFTIAARVDSDWTGNGQSNGQAFDYDEIYRKEDGNNRILFCFQNDSFFSGATPPLPGAAAVLSLGLNINGTYQELDMPLDGLSGGAGGNANVRPTLLDITTGTHLLAGTYDPATGVKAIWVDGTMLWSTAYTTGGAGLLYNSGTGNPGWIGSSGGNSETFNGVIDDFLVADRVLSGSEMAALVPEPGSVALLVFGASAIGLRRRRTT
jgi:hypothetical protein